LILSVRGKEYSVFYTKSNPYAAVPCRKPILARRQPIVNGRFELIFQAASADFGGVLPVAHDPARILPFETNRVAALFGPRVCGKDKRGLPKTLCVPTGALWGFRKSSKRGIEINWTPNRSRKTS
jgi:hypothetical protein